MRFRYVALLAMGGPGFISSARAANIAFSGPIPITTADATLDLPGTVVGAVTFGGGQPVTVTTATQVINFAHFGVLGGVANVTQAAGEITDTALYSGSGNTNFDSVLNNFAYDGGPTIIQLQNLTPGTQYQVQLFGLDDRSGLTSRTIEFSDDSGDVSSAFAEGNNVYILGTFIADAATEDIKSVGVGQSQSNFNDVVVRTAVPEPAALGLLGLGGIGLLSRRRRVRGES